MTRTRRRPRQDNPSIIRAVQTFWARYDPDSRPLVWKQSGGGIISVDGYRYSYRESLEGTTILIRGGRSEGKRPCFLLFLEPDNTATLQDVTSGEDCSLDKGATSAHVVRAAVSLAKERGKNRITLVDNSVKHLRFNKAFRLSDMYFLSTGKTWYESVLPGLKPIDPTPEELHVYRGRVTTNAWAPLSTCLGDPVDTGVVDTTQPGSAMQIFSMLKDAKTDFFAIYGKEAVICSKILSLYGSEWELDLR